MSWVMKKKRRRRIFTSISYIIVMLLILLATAELLTRMLYKTPGYGYPKGLHISDQLNGYRYKPNFRGNFVGAYSNITLNTNSKGFRDYEYNYEKGDGVKRIVVIGDSETMGAGVALEDTYAKQLEQILKKSTDNMGIGDVTGMRNVSFEVLNLGINSYEFEQEFNLLKSDGIKFNPDIVIVGFVLNDIGRVSPKSVQFREILLRQCHLCVFVKTIAKTMDFKGKSYNVNYFEEIYKKWQGSDWQYTRKQIGEMKEFAEQNNFKLIFVVFPYAEQFENNPEQINVSEPWMPQQLLKNACEENNITVVELRYLLDVPNYQQNYLNRDSLHLNSRGYRIVAQEIYKKIKEEKMI